MGKPAARIIDMHACPMVTPGTPPIPHVGGPIAMGSPNVLTGRLAQARVGDQAICIGPPDVIAVGSMGVFVNGKAAARMGDLTAHGGTVSIGLPTVLIGETTGGSGGGAAFGAGAALAFAHYQAQVRTLINAHKAGAPFCEICFQAAQAKLAKALAGRSGSVSAKLGKDGGGPHAETKASGSISRGGASAAVSAMAAVGDVHKVGQSSKVPWLGGSFDTTLLKGEVQARGQVGKGAGVSASASASAATVGGSVFLGKDANNPWFEAGATGSHLAADANVQLIDGSDGRLQGKAVGAGAGASLFAGAVKDEINIPIPFTNWTISSRSSAGASLGGVGGAAGAHAVKDTETGRYHIGGSGSAEVGGGIDLSLDLSIGPRYTTRERLY